MHGLLYKLAGHIGDSNVSIETSERKIFAWQYNHIRQPSADAALFLIFIYVESVNNYQKYKDCKAYETALQLKKEGKIKHFGISFHDNAEFLRKILNLVYNESIQEWQKLLKKASIDDLEKIVKIPYLDGCIFGRVHRFSLGRSRVYLRIEEGIADLHMPHQYTPRES